MDCPRCGTAAFENAVSCTACGMMLQREMETAGNTPQTAYTQPYSWPAPQAPYVALPMYMQPPGDKEKNWQAICSMICGIASIPMMFTMFGGLFTALAAILFSFKGFKSQKSGMAIAGIVCGCIGFSLSGIMIYSMIIGQILTPELYQ